jgi:hypothetical protein
MPIRETNDLRYCYAGFEWFEHFLERQVKELTAKSTKFDIVCRFVVC